MEKRIHRSKGSTNEIFNIFTNFRQLNINGHFKKTKKSSRLLYLYRNSRELFFCKITDCKLPFFPRFLSVVIMISILPLLRFYVIKTAWFRFWIFYCLLSLCYCYFITNSKKSFDVPFYLVYLFNSYQQKNIYQNRAAQRNLLLNSTNLENLEDESDAF